MKRIALGLVAAIFAAAAAPAFAQDAKAAKKKLLVVTESRGFKHGSVSRKGSDLSVAEVVLTAIGAQSGDYEAVCSQKAVEVITAENLKNFDAVFFYTTGDLGLSTEQKTAFIDFVKSGKGFGGSHSATDTYYKWPEYGELIGGYFDGHPWHTKVKIVIEDKKHPATKHLGDSWEITDEIYQFKEPYSREKLHVLMRLDPALKGKRKDGDNALAWTREIGKGRMFYTALGHREEVWRNEVFQKHVLGGLRYILKLEDADATPRGPLKADAKPAAGE